MHDPITLSLAARLTDDEQAAKLAARLERVRTEYRPQAGFLTDTPQPRLREARPGARTDKPL